MVVFDIFIGFAKITSIHLKKIFLTFFNPPQTPKIDFLTGGNCHLLPIFNLE